MRMAPAITLSPEQQAILESQARSIRARPTGGSRLDAAHPKAIRGEPVAQEVQCEGGYKVPK